MKYLLFIYMALVISGCAALPGTRQVTTEHGQFEVYQSRPGTGPTLVLAAGLGDDLHGWHGVIPALEPRVQVFAYNRAGIGDSTSSNPNRDARTIVGELKSLLAATAPPPPYILMGHSLGGIYMQLYARTYPEDVAGVILLDTPHPDWQQRCDAGGGQYCAPPGEMPQWARLLFPAAVHGEITAWSETMAQLRQGGPFPKVPLYVLSAGHSPWPTGQGVIDWRIARESQAALVKLSPISIHHVCGSCGHYIHRDNPAAVAEAVSWILAQQHRDNG